MKKSDVLTGVVLTLLAGLGWYETSTWKEVQTVTMSVKDYPRMIFALIGICGVIMIFRGLVSEEKSEIKFRWNTLLPVVISIVLYGIAIEYVGFIVSTAIFLIVEMYLFGERRWKHILIISIIGTMILYVIFVKILMVKL